MNEKRFVEVSIFIVNKLTYHHYKADSEAQIIRNIRPRMDLFWCNEQIPRIYSDLDLRGSNSKWILVIQLAADFSICTGI